MSKHSASAAATSPAPSATPCHRSQPRGAAAVRRLCTTATSNNGGQRHRDEQGSRGRSGTPPPGDGSQLTFEADAQDSHDEL
jgi:hypothetical protein